MKNITYRLMALLFIMPVILFGCMKEAAVVPSNDSASQSKTSSSTEDNASKTYVYIIERGNHYVNGKHFALFSGKVLSFSATFDSSAIYNLPFPGIEKDENTLCGFADNDRVHEQFSARFGWRWFNNELQIAAYTNNYSNSTIVQMGSVPLGTSSNYSIVVAGDHYEFTLNGVSISLPRASRTELAGKYKLLPYFGGDAVAPHQIAIKIVEN